MTRSDLWMQVYIAMMRRGSSSCDAEWNANAAVAAYDARWGHGTPGEVGP